MENKIQNAPEYENETEIFREWLKWYCKDSGSIQVNGEPAKAKDLAKALKISAPALSGLHSGRSIQGGGRHFPDIKLNIQNEILRITGVSREDALYIGKMKMTLKDPDRLKKIEDKLDYLLENKGPPDEAPTKIFPTEHQKKVERFKNKELGEKINDNLLEIESLDPAALVKIAGLVHDELKYLRDKYPKNQQGPQENSSAS